MTSNLYEYPDDYRGRKTYVTVRGHSGMVPKYKTYVGTDMRSHLLPEFGGDGSMFGQPSSYVLPDKQAYFSPMDRTVVEGRAAHRDHMRKHGVVEAGDMKLGEMTASREAYSNMDRAGSDIQRAMQELGSR